MLCRHNQIKILLLFRVPTWRPGRMTISKVRAESWETAGEIMYCRTQGPAVRCTQRLSPPASRGWPSPRQQSKKNWWFRFNWPDASSSTYFYLKKLYFLLHFRLRDKFTPISKENSQQMSKYKIWTPSLEYLFVPDLEGEIFQTLLCQVETPPTGNTGKTDGWG